MSDTPVDNAPVEISPADEQKKLGNACFAKREYSKAIEHYQNAIKLDDSNPFYYSNLSAAFAGQKKWQDAMEAAMTCVSKDDKFVKGYLKLATAQTELKLYDEAETTLRAALTLEPRTCPLSLWRLVVNKRDRVCVLVPSALD